MLISRGLQLWLTEEPVNIACLAWGSLVWNPKELPIQRRWFDDGPFGRVEFTRQSRDDRITLVFDEKAKPVRLLWAPMALSDVDEARKALKEREGVTGERWNDRIGLWPDGDNVHKDMMLKCMPTLPTWANARGIDAVIWTNLRPQHKVNGEMKGERPSVEWVLDHLQKLTGPARDVAEQYFRCAPRQVDTDYRRRVESTLGWVYRPC